MVDAWASDIWVRHCTHAMLWCASCVYLASCRLFLDCLLCKVFDLHIFVCCGPQA